jgi:hypothetical protein
MKPITLLLPTLLLIAGCHSEAQRNSAAASVADVQTLLRGQFDNQAQAALGKAPADAENAIPHVIVTIEATTQVDWSLWHVHLNTDAESVYEQTWAMQTRTEYDGSKALVPYYQVKQTAVPLAATFDPHAWLSLEACALRGDFGKARIRAMSEGEPCAAASMGIGSKRALLPVAIEREGDSLHFDLNYKSARTRIDARRR